MVPDDESSQIRAATEIELGHIHRSRPAVLRAKTLKKFQFFLEMSAQKIFRKGETN